MSVHQPQDSGLFAASRLVLHRLRGRHQRRTRQQRRLEVPNYCKRCRNASLEQLPPFTVFVDVDSPRSASRPSPPLSTAPSPLSAPAPSRCMSTWSTSAAPRYPSRTKRRTTPPCAGTRAHRRPRADHRPTRVVRHGYLPAPSPGADFSHPRAPIRSAPRARRN